MRNIDKQLIDKVVNKLKYTSFDFDATSEVYNPMELFASYVTTKEIVHTAILYDLLNPFGRHHLKDRFAFAFISEFCGDWIQTSDILSITPYKEYKVNRVVTEGEQRSIDILLDIKYKDNRKVAIIIENKLNNAPFQPKQLEDYCRAIQKESYDCQYTICLTKLNVDLGENKKFCNKILYPKHLAEWILGVVDNDPSKYAVNLKSYVSLLNNLHRNNSIHNNAMELLNNPEILDDARKIAEAYNELNFNLLDFIKERLINDWQEIIVSYKGDNIQIYNQEDYNKNGCWIMVWRKFQERENEVYIVTFKNESRQTEVLTKADYHLMDDDTYNLNWYKSSNDSLMCFKYPDKIGFDNMISEINRVLNILH